MQANVTCIIKDWKENWSGKEIEDSIRWMRDKIGDNDFEVFEVESPSDASIIVFGPDGLSQINNLENIIDAFISGLTVRGTEVEELHFDGSQLWGKTNSGWKTWDEIEEEKEQI